MITAELYTINTIELFDRLEAYTDKLNPEFMFIDAETDSEIERKARLFGLGIAYNDKKAFYIAWRHKDGSEVWSKEEASRIVNWLFKVASKTKVIGHNVLYDVLVIEYNLGIDISSYIYSDTILLKHTLDEEIPHGLKETAVKYLGIGADKAQQKLKENILANGGKWLKKQKDMYKADTEILAEYCCWDVLLTLKLFELFEPRLKAEGLADLFYKDEIMPLYREVTIPMKRLGFPVDIEHFTKLKAEMQIDIANIEKEITDEIQPHIDEYESKLLNEEFPIKKSGLFPKVLAEQHTIPLPVAKKKNKETGEITYNQTLAAGAIKQQLAATPEFSWFYNWILSKEDTVPEQVKQLAEKVQKYLYFRKHETNHVFNLKSGDDIAHLLYTSLGIDCNAVTESGKPSTKADVLDDIIEVYSRDYPFLAKLMDYRKLSKLLSTYVDSILEKNIDGIIYASMLQFGTTSGRYASRNPNLQNQPRIKEDEGEISAIVLKYTNLIKKGFIAPKGYKIVNADYSSLEPICFSHMSNSESLRNVFRKGEDLYSRVAIDVNHLENEYSANKKADNFLKKHKPELRQLWKVPPLGIVYGMGEARLMQAIGCDYNEAKHIITSYLNTYPELKKYMFACDFSARTKGYVKTQFGRIRHLPRAKQLFSKYGEDLLNFKWAKSKNLLAERRELKNLLNNAKNFPIQALAAHIVNRGAIATVRNFKNNNITGWLAIQVHDELTTIVKEEQAELASKLLKEAMEQTTQISVPLTAVPVIGINWAESK